MLNPTPCDAEEEVRVARERPIRSIGGVNRKTLKLATGAISTSSAQLRAAPGILKSTAPRGKLALVAGLEPATFRLTVGLSAN